MRTSLLIVAFLFSTSVEAATIVGTVKDPATENNSPVVGAKVVAVASGNGEPRTTTTDGDGNYRFENLPSGTLFKLEYRKTGYLRNPEEAEATTEREPVRVDAFLARSTEGPAYFRRLAHRIIEAHKVNEEVAGRLYRIYEAMPRERQEVIEEEFARNNFKRVERRAKD